MHYVYVLQSEVDQSFYKGYTENPLVRLYFHNSGLSPYTSGRKPWRMVALFEFEIKREALQREKRLKKYGKKSLESLIESDRNMLIAYMQSLENR